LQLTQGVFIEECTKTIPVIIEDGKVVGILNEDQLLSSLTSR
jgi:CBS-domain-containing membrane protein